MDARRKRACGRLCAGRRKPCAPGDNVLLYPSGGLTRTGRERLGGNRGAAMLREAVPDARIVLVRTTGLWGSSFSWPRQSARQPARSAAGGAAASAQRHLLHAPPPRAHHAGPNPDCPRARPARGRSTGRWSPSIMKRTPRRRWPYPDTFSAEQAPVPCRNARQARRPAGTAMPETAAQGTAGPWTPRSAGPYSTS